MTQTNQPAPLPTWGVLNSVTKEGDWSRVENEAGSTLYVFKRTEHELAIPLTDEEKARLAEDLAETYGEDQALDAEKKDWLAGWKSRKEQVAKRRTNKIVAINTGKERRIVEADEFFDHGRKVHYFVAAVGSEKALFLERPMKEAEFLVGMPQLFPGAPAEGEDDEATVHEIRPGAVEGELVASSEDGKGTKLTGRGKRLQPLGPGMSAHPDSDIGQVMREEKSARSKHDHTT
jgi:hypothetical protein